MKKNGLGYCSDCDGVVSFSAKTCPHCGATFYNDDAYETIVSEDGYKFYKYSNNEGDAFISNMTRAQREQKNKEEREILYPIMFKLAKSSGIKDEVFYDELKCYCGIKKNPNYRLKEKEYTRSSAFVIISVDMMIEAKHYYENLSYSEQVKLEKIAQKMKNSKHVNIEEIKLPNFKKDTTSNGETTSNGDGFSLDDNYWFKTLLVAIVLVFIAIFMVVALR